MKYLAITLQLRRRQFCRYRENMYPPPLTRYLSLKKRQQNVNSNTVSRAQSSTHQRFSSEDKNLFTEIYCIYFRKVELNEYKQ